MRLRVGVVVCLFLAFVAASCRKGLEPNTDHNSAPETWITAAPQDTITTKDSQGRPIPPVEGRIPIRFHLYWAGADKDGAVAGFYWAVTETVATSAGDGLPIPGLPGPKASDYHFTTRTDSTFVFPVSADSPEREHAFYIYAVDDKGKGDPTPAKFVFRAYDRYPPTPEFTRSEAVGSVYTLQAGGVVKVTRTYPVHDIFYFGHSFPTDTVPTGSLLQFAWRGVSRLSNNPVTGYRYRLEEPEFNVVDSSVHSVTYGTGVGLDVIPPGIKKFSLQALDRSGGHGDSTRFFMMNFAPDDWFAGPDTLSSFWTTHTDGNGKRYYYKDITSLSNPSMTWASFVAAGGATGTMLSPDSANVLPVNRPSRRTFFEIYAGRLWAHGEGDTVNLNSWVIVPSGGYDKDSPYAVKVGIDPNKPVGPVVVPAPPNGSPIGFRNIVFTRLFDGGLISPSETTTYPVFDVASVYWKPLINGYCEMNNTGKAYFYAVAEDGDGAVDRRLDGAGGAPVVADRVDRDTIGTGHTPPSPTLVQTQLREKVLTFYVNHAPYLLTCDGTFFPRPAVACGGPVPAPSTIHTGTIVSLNLPADDVDPIDYAVPLSRTGGPQPSNPKVLVRTARLKGKVAGVDSTLTLAENVELSQIAVPIPAYFDAGSAHVLITLCDYRPTDVDSRHWGRCAPTLDIPVTIITGTQPVENATGTSLVSPQSTQRPGSLQAVGRRQLP